MVAALAGIFFAAAGFVADFFGLASLVLSSMAARTSALNAAASTSTPSRMSMARGAIR